MKILFVCYEYCGKRDAGSQCIHNLREELHQRGIQSDVLTYNWSGKEAVSVSDMFGSIFTAKTWYRYSRVTRTANGRIKMPLQQWLLVLFTRTAAMLLDGMNYVQRGMPYASTRMLRKQLAMLCKKEQYDWVVSVSYPFANHLAVLKACAGMTKVALYNLDPYWNNYTYNPQKREARAREESKAYEKAACVFCTPEQLADYNHKQFAHVRNKIFPLSYPNFTKPQMGKISDIRFDTQDINLLYLGTVYGDIRKPEVLLQLFEQAIQQEPRLHLYIIGKKFGADADRYLSEYEGRLKSNLTIAGPVPIEETNDLLQQADVLINLGNTMPNQMPSKTLEYLATGKPIVNISAVQNCNTLPFISRYPLALQYAGYQKLTENQIDEFMHFCQNQKGNSLLWKDVAAIYSEILPPEVVNRLLSVLQSKI